MFTKAVHSQSSRPSGVWPLWGLSVAALMITGMPIQANESEKRYVLLQSDKVLTGRMLTATSQSVTVELETRSTLSIPIRQIVAIESSPEMLHLSRQQSLRRRGQDWQSLGHDPRHALNRLFRDAQWCWDLELHRQVRAILANARRIDPTDPRIDRFADRLDHPPAEEAKRVQRVSFESDVGSLPVSQDLDRQVDDLADFDPRLLHTYTSRIQPILFSRCGKCHDDRFHSGTWSLTMPLRDRRSPVSATKRNLGRTVAAIKTQSDRSWLDWAQQFHGDEHDRNGLHDKTATPPIAEHESMLLDTLTRWTQWVEGSPGARSSLKDGDPSRLAAVPGEPKQLLAKTKPAIEAETSLDGDQSEKLSPTGVRRLPRVTDPNSARLFNRETEILQAIRWPEPVRLP